MLREKSADVAKPSVHPEHPWKRGVKSQWSRPRSVSLIIAKCLNMRHGRLGSGRGKWLCFLILNDLRYWVPAGKTRVRSGTLSAPPIRMAIALLVWVGLGTVFCLVVLRSAARSQPSPGVAHFSHSITSAADSPFVSESHLSKSKSVRLDAPCHAH